MYQNSLPEERKNKLDMTVEYLNITSTTIDIFHSNVPFTSAEDSRLECLKACLAWLDQWENEVNLAPGTASDRKKMILSPKTMFNMRSMISGFCAIVREVVSRSPGSQIMAWRANTSLVEKIFCQQRGYHGQNDNPRYGQYASGMNSILLGQKTSTVKNNTGNTESLPFYRPSKLQNK